MRLLLVEDDRRLSAVLTRGLREAGYMVDVAYDGSAGLAAAESNAYDLVLLDLMLPEQDGLSVCRTLRQRKVRVPIIAITALDSTEERIEGLDAGADDYLVKPFVFAELAARLRAVLRRESLNRSSELSLGSLRIDLAARRVWRGEQEVALTARELAMLEYFLLHPDMVLTRSALEERVWRNEFTINSNVVDVYVRRLRQALGAEGQRIETVRGSGYRLCVRQSIYNA
ncbi:MAG: response regulator transcription factor [Chloroflexota bacterium]|nr:response regulator transcription factor [Chloroflexota bacterium]